MAACCCSHLRRGWRGAGAQRGRAGLEFSPGRDSRADADSRQTAGVAQAAHLRAAAAATTSASLVFGSAPGQVCRRTGMRVRLRRRDARSVGRLPSVGRWRWRRRGERAGRAGQLPIFSTAFFRDADADIEWHSTCSCHSAVRLPSTQTCALHRTVTMLRGTTGCCRRSRCSGAHVLAYGRRGSAAGKGREPLWWRESQGNTGSCA